MFSKEASYRDLVTRQSVFLIVRVIAGQAEGNGIESHGVSL
jgi:hypothetical protein